MRPFMHNGDVVEIEPLVSVPALGDVVLVRCGSDGERYVLHRVVRVRGEKLFIRGDAQDHCEGPFTREDVLGSVTKMYSNGRVRRFDAGLWRFAGMAWHLCFPLSVWLLRLAVRLQGDPSIPFEFPQDRPQGERSDLDRFSMRSSNCG